MSEQAVMHAGDWPPELWLKNLTQATSAEQQQWLTKMLPLADSRLMQILWSQQENVDPEALPAFYRLLGRIGSADTVPLLLKQLLQARPAQQGLILEALTALGYTQAALPVLKACQQGQLACSEALELCLCWLLPHSAWPHVQNNHLSRRLQSAWADGLPLDQMPGLPVPQAPAVHDTRPGAVLEKLVVHEQADTWLQAARTLCRRAEPQHHFFYRSCLQQPDPELRALALSALAQIQALQLADIGWLMQDVAPQVRLAAMVALTHVKAASMARWKLLKQALQDPARQVQYQALQSLLQGRIRPALPAIIQRLPTAPVVELPLILGYLQALPTAAGYEVLQSTRQSCPGWLWPVWQNSLHLLAPQLPPSERKVP